MQIFFAQILVKPLFSHKTGFLLTRVICKSNHRVYESKDYMNRSTFCEIKYMNGLFFSKARYMIRVGFKEYRRYVPGSMQILDTRSEVEGKVTVTRKLYRTLRNPEMHPHTDF